MENRKRPKQVKFWVTEEELIKIKNNAKKSNLTQSEYLIRSAMDKKILVIDGLKEILIELSKEGNNLSQIMRKVNNSEDFDTSEFIETKEKLMDLWSLIEKTLREGNE